MNLQDLIDYDLWNSVESNFIAGKYSNSIIDAMLFLSNRLREKTDLEEDGVPLISKIFSKSDPKIKINKLETQSERNMQDGISSILRGMYQLIRNPRHHDIIEDNESDAVKIIVFVDYVLGIIDVSKSKFEKDDFLNLVFDDNFVNEAKYAELLVNKVPIRKRFDILLEIYRDKERANINNISRIFEAFFELLDEKEIHQLMKIISDDLQKTNNDKERQYIFKILPVEKWNDIDEIPRMRTENIIIKSILEGKTYETQKSSEGWLATWAAKHLDQFSDKDKIINTIHTKLLSEEISQIKYCFRFLFDKFWVISGYRSDKASEKIEKINSSEFYDYDVSNSILKHIKENIEKGNKLYFDYFNSHSYIIPSVVNKYVEESLEKFIYDEKIPILSNEDIEFSPDDIPF